MKKLILKLGTLSIILTTCQGGIAETGKDKIVSAVNQFVKASDNRNAANLNKVLHHEFRAMVNRLFGSEDMSIMTKDTYLSLIKEEKIGGDDRKVNILKVDVVNHNAYVKAELHGKEYKFTTYILLAERPKGNWQVVSDMPFIEKVQ